jgi:hypothetical protein
MNIFNHEELDIIIECLEREEKCLDKFADRYSIDCMNRGIEDYKDIILKLRRIKRDL